MWGVGKRDRKLYLDILPSEGPLDQLIELESDLLSLGTDASAKMDRTVDTSLEGTTAVPKKSSSLQPRKTRVEYDPENHETGWRGVGRLYCVIDDL